MRGRGFDSRVRLCRLILLAHWKPCKIPALGLWYYEGFVAFLSLRPNTLKAGKPMPYPEVPKTLGPSAQTETRARPAAERRRRPLRVPTPRPVRTGRRATRTRNSASGRGSSSSWGTTQTQGRTRVTWRNASSGLDGGRPLAPRACETPPTEVPASSDEAGGTSDRRRETPAQRQHRTTSPCATFRVPSSFLVLHPLERSSDHFRNRLACRLLTV